LFLSEFYPQRIKANPSVIAFYESFPDISTENMQTYIDTHKPKPTTTQLTAPKPTTAFMGNTITNYTDHSRKNIKVVSW
jgi:hypothetical protein